MSTTGNPPAGSSATQPPEDPIKQLKSEMSRKTDNLAAQLALQNQQLQQFMEVMRQQAEAARVPQQQPKAPDAYRDPEAFAAYVAAQAQQKSVEAVSQITTQQSAIAQKSQAVLNQLAADYPEINDRTSELFQRAQEVQAQMDPSERFTPTGLRAAIREAAADVGLLPLSKRTQPGKANQSEDTDFTVSGGGNPATRTPRSPNVDPEREAKILATAELMGIKINDPKQREAVLKRDERKTWTKYR